MPVNCGHVLNIPADGILSLSAYHCLYKYNVTALIMLIGNIILKLYSMRVVQG
jgi:hypothetical protein